jgi:hypothetical protein
MGEMHMLERKSPREPSSHGCIQERNSTISDRNELRTLAIPTRTNIAGEILSGEQISFVEFVTSAKYESYVSLLCGEVGTAAAKMVSEFAKAEKIPLFFYGKPGMLTDNSKTKDELKKFARRAYRGDPERRGVSFWTRVAWLLWNMCASFNALIGRSAKIAQQESDLLKRNIAKRPARAAYMRAYRAREAAKKGAQLARYFKPEARARWRRQREQSR